MADVLGFQPAFGKAEDLGKVTVKDGQFICTIDDSKIYVDYNGTRRLVGVGNNQNNISRGTFAMINWVYDEDNEIYIQEVAMPKVTGNHALLVDLVVSSSPDVGIEEDNEWGKVTKIMADEGKVIGYCYGSQPNIDLSFQVREI